MYGWTMEQGTVLWSINMSVCAPSDMKTVEEGNCKIPTSSGVSTTSQTITTWESLIEKPEPYFRIEGVEQNGKKGTFTITKGAADCSSEMVVLDLNRGPCLLGAAGAWCG